MGRDVQQSFSFLQTDGHGISPANNASSLQFAKKKLVLNILGALKKVTILLRFAQWNSVAGHTGSDYGGNPELLRDIRIIFQ